MFEEIFQSEIDKWKNELMAERDAIGQEKKRLENELQGMIVRNAILTKLTKGTETGYEQEINQEVIDQKTRQLEAFTTQMQAKLNDINRILIVINIQIKNITR